uniref:Zinc finger CCCH domain-containing protein 38 n=1 Tax=Noccaea caerulescens TaxID=107243 RepID=A0A1J3C9P9_NOCCA
MSGSGRKSVSKWDSKEEDTQHLIGNDYMAKPSSYFRDKDPENARFYPEGNGRNGSRRSAPDDDDDEDDEEEQHLKPRQQHSGEAWPPPSRSRVSHDNDGRDAAAMMGYYDTRKSSEQDDTNRQPYFRPSPSRERPRTRRSGSRSNSRSRSRSRSRSPMQRVRRDAGGSYDRHKTRARVSPQSGRYNRAGGGDYDWEAKNRKTRDTKYYIEDSRQQYPVRMSARSEYGSGFQDDNCSRREASDPTILRSHRNESARERRDVSEGDFHRSSNVPCRFFASGSGYCRNGNNCRFSHHGAARGSPERKPQNEAFSRQDSSNNHHTATTERMRNSQRWNDIERSDTGKSSEVEISRKAMPEAKGNNGSSWIDDMEMSPDWNYGVKTLKKPMNEGSQQSRVLKDALAPAYEQDGNQRTVVASSHHNFSNNNLAHSDPPPPPPPPPPLLQAFNQNIENHSAVTVPYQSTPLTVGGSQQVMLPAATNLHGGLNLSIAENGNAQNSVSREELNHISNISASLAQFFGNGQPIPIPQIHSALNPNQAMQVPEVYAKQEQPSHTQSVHTVGVPAVTASQINNMDTQVRIPDNLVSLAENPNALLEEDQDKKTDEEARKESEGINKAGEVEEEDIAEDAENVVEEEEDDENSKKGGKDPKGMRAFKFALVEIVKELLKPAWKEGGMNKDAYKNIVKKVVDKVTGAIQTGNIPQTQEKIDHYLSASKPKLTKLVQAYVSKVKKS